MDHKLSSFTDVLGDEVHDSQPISLSPNSISSQTQEINETESIVKKNRPPKHTGQYGDFRSIDEIDAKYRHVFTYPFFNLVQSGVIEDALYSDKSMVVCAPTGSGKTVIFEMAIVQLLMNMDNKNYSGDFKIIYMAPVKALCTERLTEWYPKFTQLGLLCIEVTGDTDVDFNQLKPYRIIITTPEKWDMLTRRWRDHRSLVEVIKLFLIDEVHILNDAVRGPVLEAVVSRMKTIQSSAQSAHRIEYLKRKFNSHHYAISVATDESAPPRIRFVAVSATVSNPEDVATWLGSSDKPAVYYRFGDECRPVKLKRIVEGYPCSNGTSIFKFDIILNYKLWPIIQKYHNGKPTLIFCNTRKSVILTAETLSREITINFNQEQKDKLMTLASTIKNKKLQSLILAGVACHHAGLLFEERSNIEKAFRNRDLPILITTTTLAMGVNLPAHLVIIKNTQQYVNGAYQEYSISTVLQMVGRAGRPQYDTEATAVIMTRLNDKSRYQALVGGSEPLQSYLHKRLAENLNSETALGTVNDVAQCVQWLRSTFLYVRAARDPRRYLGLPINAPGHMISKKIEELCVRAMNGLASAGLITMDEASCIESTEAGRLMSVFYLDLETMKHIMKVYTFLVLLFYTMGEIGIVNPPCPNGIIQAILGCLPIPDPSLHQEAMKIMRIADRVCKCLVAYVTRPDLISQKPKYLAAVVNSVVLAKCIAAHLWENSPYVSRQMKGIGPTFSTLLATAGKTNFMLLEESHPRDLERIMNKGPPAGNVLRKQISLLPKYDIKITPVDDKTVSIQVELLNKSYLLENIEHLTAGESHKSYIIVGDSDNHVLLLATFKDKDLIGVYDARITYNITRKHNYEHKIIVNCISSNFVGIDAGCEYLFKDLENLGQDVSMLIPGNVVADQTMRRDTRTIDESKQRKRKHNDTDITISRQKKKRECDIAERVKILKQSFEKTAKEVKDNFRKSEETSKNMLQELIYPNKEEFEFEIKTSSKLYKNNISEINMDMESQDNNILIPENEQQINHSELLNNNEIDNILNEIENEISEVKTVSTLRNNNTFGFMHASNNIRDLKNNSRLKIHKYNAINSNKNQNNFNCSNMNKIENGQLNLSSEEVHDHRSTDTKFIDTIKLQLNNYLQQIGESVNKPKYNNINIDELLIEEINQENIIKNENSLDNAENVEKWTEKTISPENYMTLDNTVHLVEVNNVSIVENKCELQKIDNASHFAKREKIDNEEKKENQYNCTPEISKCLMVFKNMTMENTKSKTKTKRSNLMSNSIRNISYRTSPGMVNNKLIKIKLDQKLEKIIHYDNFQKNPVELDSFNSGLCNISPVQMKNHNSKIESMRKYPYMSNQINVSTNNTINRQVCIIKHLTVDLDIKAIVTDRNHCDRNIINFNEVNKMKCINAELPSFIQCCVSGNPCRDVINKAHESEIAITFAKDEKLNSKTKNSLNLNTTCDAKLENILQKYKTVLRKNYVQGVKETKETNNYTNSNKVYEIKIKKEKRPFKIADLNKLDISLSEIVTEDTESEGYKKMNAIDDDKHLLQISNHTIDRIENEIDFNIVLNSTEPDIPNPILLDTIVPSNDFKIDESMFNPKTLLQCLTKEDDDIIIPPPIEFRDATYSPGHDQDTFVDSYRMHPNKSYTECDKEYYKINILEENHYESIVDTILSDDTTSLNEVKTSPITHETIYSNELQQRPNSWTIHRNYIDRAKGVEKHSKLNRFKFMRD
ncbi:probable ATP-dependent DNA helicase HFM1 [Achroia grisella]|uniref:probable ATP-dependent DNA helicase HFM1 n=1 Tax=Achroia grisella TaxID=688607 RepID=UPI0027D2C13B|nr:probable ATP-dependent DNA helicase HFM1 [Achroia grisella]